MISLTPLIDWMTPKPLDFDGLWFRQVAGGASYAQIDPENIPTPTAWIVRASDKVTHAGERAEDVELAFDVVIAIENAREHRPGEMDDMLLLYRSAVKKLLLGWMLQPEVRPIRWNGGRFLRVAAGDLIYADNFSFEAEITNYLEDPPPYLESVFTGETQ